MFSAKIELKQMHIDASHGPDCLGKLRKIENGSSNFDIYYDTANNFFMSIAKPNSGCISSFYGDSKHIKKALRNGWIKEHGLTKFGRRLINSI